VSDTPLFPLEAKISTQPVFEQKFLTYV